jgi:2-hydroxychromene-2-carboxylate isomerase
MPEGAFYFDLASPLAYLAAERILHATPGPLPWVPVLARELPGAESFQAFRCQAERDILFSEVERRAAQLGLQPLVWPAGFPFDSEMAMCAATYARAIGRAVPFAQAAFRQAFAAGRDLSRPDWIAVAGAACEMHPRALLAGARQRNVREELRQATQEAVAAGVSDVPAVRIGTRILHGERALDQATGLVAGAPAE